jgi:hypothetical protein
MTTADYPDSRAAGGLGGDVGASSTAPKEQAKQAAGTAADEGKHVAGVAQNEAQRVGSEAKSQVRGLLDQTTSMVEEQSRTQRDHLVETLRSFGDDLEKMAQQSDGGPASGLARDIAERARGLSARMDGREPRELLDEVRSYARRKPGTFLLGALAAGVVAGRLTRGAKDAQSGSAGSPTEAQTGTGTTYGSSRAADVTSPGDPLSAGAAAPSSGPVFDPSTQGHGTASGTPLAGTGAPESEPVYPAGSEETDTGLPHPGGSVASGASWSDTGTRRDLA